MKLFFLFINKLKLNVKAGLNKLKINKDGKYLKGEIIETIESVLESINKKEGCHLIGNFNIKKVYKV